MSTPYDITKSTKQESESSISEPHSKNAADAGRACNDDYPELISHHNERRARGIDP